MITGSIYDRMSKDIHAFSDFFEDDIYNIISRNGVIQSLRVSEFIHSREWPYNLIADVLSTKYELGNIGDLTELEILNGYDSILIGETNDEIFVGLVNSLKLAEGPVKKEPIKSDSTIHNFARFMPIPKI